VAMSDPHNVEKMKDALNELGKAISIGTITILELTRGDRPYWGVVRSRTYLGLIPITIPMPLEEAQAWAIIGDVWTRHGVRAPEVYPQGAKGPEIDCGGPRAQPESFPLGQLRYCHYHPRTGNRTRSFFGLPHASRISNDECVD